MLGSDVQLPKGTDDVCVDCGGDYTCTVSMQVMVTIFVLSAWLFLSHPNWYQASQPIIPTTVGQTITLRRVIPTLDPHPDISFWHSFGHSVYLTYVLAFFLVMVMAMMMMMMVMMMMMMIVIITVPNSYHSVTYHCYSFIPFRQSLQGSCVLLLQPTWHHIALRWTNSLG